MFFLTSDLVIRSKLGLDATAIAVAEALEIPRFKLDDSGRYEELEAYVSRALGLQFMFCRPPGAAEGEYGLSVDSRSEAFKYDHGRKDLDLTQYLLLMLQRSKSLQASPRPAKK